MMRKPIDPTAIDDPRTYALADEIRQRIGDKAAVRLFHSRKNGDARKRASFFVDCGQPEITLIRDYFIWSVVWTQAIITAATDPRNRDRRHVKKQPAIDAVAARGIKFGIVRRARRGNVKRGDAKEIGSAGIERAFQEIENIYLCNPSKHGSARIEGSRHWSQFSTHGAMLKAYLAAEDMTAEQAEIYAAEGWRTKLMMREQGQGVLDHAIREHVPPSPVYEKVSNWMPSWFAHELLKLQLKLREHPGVKSFRVALPHYALNGPATFYGFSLGRWKLSSSDVDALEFALGDVKHWGYRQEGPGRHDVPAFAYRELDISAWRG